MDLLDLHVYTRNIIPSAKASYPPGAQSLCAVKKRCVYGSSRTSNVATVRHYRTSNFASLNVNLHLGVNCVCGSQYYTAQVAVVARYPHKRCVDTPYSDAAVCLSSHATHTAHLCKCFNNGIHQSGYVG